MVFYIIAYLDNKTKSEERSRDKVREKFPNMGGREHNQLVDIKLNKTVFKVGSLDQLMSLNESAAKLDA